MYVNIPNMDPMGTVVKVDGGFHSQKGDES